MPTRWFRRDLFSVPKRLRRSARAGVYHFPVEELKSRPFDDIQCSSYDVEACRWSNIPEDDWMLQDDEPWVIGEFVWTGFDYLGEPTPYDEVWPSRSFLFLGICDLAGLPKDRYWLYRSHWRTDVNTLHAAAHWYVAGTRGRGDASVLLHQCAVG